MVVLRAAAAAWTARAADGVEIVGVRENSKSPSRSLTLSAPNTRIGTDTPARRRTIPSSISAHASIVAPACSSARATRSAPWPYALALTTAIIAGGVGGAAVVAGVLERKVWIARKLDCSAARSTRATVLRITRLERGSQIASARGGTRAAPRR